MKTSKNTILNNSVLARLKPRQGQVLPLIAIALPLLIGLAGLSLTVGTVYFGQAKLQNAVDAAALAGAQEMNTGDAKAPGDQASLVTQDDSAATHIVLKTLTNPPHTVMATAQAQVPGTFAALFGIHHFTVKAQARAAYGAGAPFNYAVFQGDPHAGDPPLRIHGANIIAPIMGTGGADVHSNDNVKLDGATIVQGACSAVGTVTVNGAGSCSQGQTSGASTIAMPNWSTSTLVQNATQVIGSPQNPQGYTFNGAAQFQGRWVVFGNVKISGAINGPGSIVAIGGSITIEGAASFGTTQGQGVCFAALPPASSPQTPENITIQGAHSMTGVLYAPTGTITLGGADIIQGSVIGYRVSLGGAGIIEYDPTQQAIVPVHQVALIQ
jgi:hypothetical protein